MRELIVNNGIYKYRIFYKKRIGWLYLCEVERPALSRVLTKEGITIAHFTTDTDAIEFMSRISHRVAFARDELRVGFSYKNFKKKSEEFKQAKRKTRHLLSGLSFVIGEDTRKAKFKPSAELL